MRSRAGSARALQIQERLSVEAQCRQARSATQTYSEFGGRLGNNPIKQVLRLVKSVVPHEIVGESNQEVHRGGALLHVACNARLKLADESAP